MSAPRVDVLLTHANHLFADPKQVRKMQPYPPLHTLLAAADLRRAGHSVALFDTTFEPPLPGFARALSRHRPRLVAIIEDNFNFLTKMCLTQNREHALAMIGQARGAGLPVLVNGSDATDRPEVYGQAGATVLPGRPERRLLEEAAALLPEARPAKPGPASAPAWDLIDLAPYRRAWREAHGRFSLHLVSSRGCPYRCNWCAKPIFGADYQVRPARAVAEEMAHAKNTLRAEHIWFADDIFALSNRWTLEFAREVEGLNARLPFKMQSRCDLMTRPTVAALAEAGCEEVWMGAESGSQKVLDAMDKDMRVEQIAEARDNLRRHGIRACYFLQFGYPGETWDDIQATLAMVRATRPDDIGVSVSYPLPGTTFHERVAAGLDEKRNWEHSDDLSMIFHGAYDTEFYRALRDAFHAEVEMLNGRSLDTDPGPLWLEVARLEKTCGALAPTAL
jgi:radical SAM superfamily enzyme YgiQ (UPF0313 family)